MRSCLLFLLLLLRAGLVIPATPLAAQETPAVAAAATTITPQDVARHVAVLAADSMRGRDTPSPGLELTAQYVAAAFEQYGLKPGGERGGWLQRYPLVHHPSATAPNTVGLLEGSDPTLKHEYVVISAHMDHVGVGAGGRLGIPGGVGETFGSLDSVYNGADDNASGTAGLLELAEAFSRPGARPRRSLIFLAVGGQYARRLANQAEGKEVGEQGSKYFAAHSPVPRAQIVAVLNLDMIGRNWPDQIAALGQEYSDLGGTLRRVAAAHPELRMAVVDDSIWPRLRLWTKTAYYQRALLHFRYPFYFEVPGLTFFNEYHPDYMRSTDTADLINAEKASRVLRLAFYVGQELGTAAQRPAWSEAGQRFRATAGQGTPVPRP